MEVQISNIPCIETEKNLNGLKKVPENIEPQKLGITVGELLQTSYFHDSQLLAGRDGLNRMVKWIQPYDITLKIKEFVNGLELVLTSGAGFTGNEKIFEDFLFQLIDKNVSGLCIEIGECVQQIPEKIIEIANRNDFPLLTIPSTSRFIDITSNLNELIIKQKFYAFFWMEDFLRPLNSLLISVHKFEDILNFAHKNLGINVAYIPVDGKSLFFPNVPLEEQLSLINCFQQASNSHIQNNKQPYRAIKKVVAFHQTWGNLIFFCFDRDLTPFELQVLDRFSDYVAQDLIRKNYIEEKKTFQDNKWVEEWLDNKMSISEIQNHLNDTFQKHFQSSAYIALIVKQQSIDNINNINYDLIINSAVVARNIFESNGFSIVYTTRANQIIYVLLDKKSANREQRLVHSVKQLKETITGNSGLEDEYLFGIGTPVKQILEISKSLKSAQETIYIQERIYIDEPFFDHLHVFQIVLDMDKAGNLREFVNKYLSPIIEYDTKYNGDLLRTLKIYYACNCSKQEAAKNLFIARQTMYQRFGKLKELLGPDLMVSKKRLAIEIAIYGYTFLQGKADL